MLHRKGKKRKIQVSRRCRYLWTFAHLCTWKYCICIFALINQSIKGCCPWKDTLRANHPFVIAEESHTFERAMEARQRQRQRERVR